MEVISNAHQIENTEKLAEADSQMWAACLGQEAGATLGLANLQAYVHSITLGEKEASKF